MGSVLDTALPFFALIFCGYVAGRAKLFDEPGAAGLNAFVFYFALPAFLFGLMSRASPSEVANFPFVASWLGVGLAIFAAAALAGRSFFGVRPCEAAVQGLAAVLPNTGYMGLPLAAAVLGEGAAVPIAVAITIDVAVLIPTGIAIIEADKGQGRGWRRIASSTLGGLVRNPLVVAIFARLLVSATGFGLPAPVSGLADLLGRAAGPCALFALGATLARRPISSGAAEVSFLTVLKLLVHPAAIWLATTQLFAVTPLWATAATLGAALPIAANTFVVARQYNTYVSKTSSAILVSTTLSLLTVPTLIATLPHP